MIYELPSDFYEQLDQKYQQALESENVKFNGDSASSEIIHDKVGDSNVDFQITLIQSLMHRPEKGTKEKNPFAKPEPELTIVDEYGPDNEFRIVFNKFPVVARHFMMLTKEFKPQETPLSPSELIGVYSILTKLKSSSKHKWFAFYNSGQESGASQPHKHVQFMTLPEDFTPYASELANTSSPFIPNQQNEPLQNKDLPFAHFVGRLPSNELDLENEDLAMYFVSLLQRCLTVLKHNGANHISYNFVMTTDYMMMVPRSTGSYNDSMGINSCGFMGLFLCKNKELQDLVKKEGPASILEKCGFPNTAGEGTDEYHY